MITFWLLDQSQMRRCGMLHGIHQGTTCTSTRTEENPHTTPHHDVFIGLGIVKTPDESHTLPTKKLRADCPS